MDIIKEMVGLVLMGLWLITIKHFWGFEMAVIIGLSVIYSLHFRPK